MNPPILNRRTLILLFISLLPLRGLAGVPDAWTSSYDEAQARAKAEGTHLLLFFTGSDWCGWCHRLRDEVLATQHFLDWAEANLELVYVDFPREDYRSEAVQAQNRALDNTYDVSGYPTVILIQPDGTELDRYGYMEGGPKTFVRAIQWAIRKSG